MKLLKRRAREAPSFASQCERRHTAQGRIAHLWYPDHGALSPFGRAADILETEPLPTCEFCKDAAGIVEAMSR